MAEDANGHANGKQGHCLKMACGCKWPSPASSSPHDRNSEKDLEPSTPQWIQSLFSPGRSLIHPGRRTSTLVLLRSWVSVRVPIRSQSPAMSLVSIRYLSELPPTIRVPSHSKMGNLYLNLLFSL